MKSILLTGLVIAGLFMTATFVRAEDAASSAKQGVGVVRPGGEPDAQDEESARIIALRQIITDWMKSRPETTKVITRAAETSLSKMDLKTLRALFVGDEVVTDKFSRKSYLEVHVAATPKPVAIEGWIAQLPINNPLQKLRLMVVVTESFRQQPLEDTAAETQILKSFLDEGYRPMDQKQTETIRGKDLIKRAMKGDQKELLAVAQGWGAELLVVGEAAVEGVPSRSDLGQVAAGTIDLRVIRVDTGELISSESASAEGVDPAQLVAVKKAIGRAGKKGADQTIANLEKAKPEKMKVSLAGADFDQKMKFVDLLVSLKELVHGDPDELSYQDSRAELEVVTDAKASEFATAVYKAAKKQGMPLKVTEQSGRRCVFEIVAAVAPPPPAAAK